jgi:hypothetical protein
MGKLALIREAGVGGDLRQGEPAVSLQELLGSLYSASGDPPPEKRWRFLFGKDEMLLSTASEPDTLPAWLTEQDVEAFTAEFTRTGFRGGLNWYRILDRMWELTPFLNGAKLRQPTLFVAGERDVCITMYRDAFEALPQTVPGLRQRPRRVIERAHLDHVGGR